jgi:hypothetical protein
MKNGRIRKVVLKVIFTASLVVIAVFFILKSVIQKKIRQELTSLSPAMQVKFSSIHINLFSSSVSLDSLDVSFIPYANRRENKHVLHFSQVSLKGISFLKFLFSKNLSVNNFILDEGNIQLDQFLLDKKDSAQAKIFTEIKWPFKKLFINNIELKNATTFLHSSRADQLLAKGDLAIGQVKMNSDDSIFHFAAIDCSLSGISYAIPHSNDSIHIQKLIMNSRRETLQIDSLHIDSPNEVEIPSIKINGFNAANLLKGNTVAIKKIKIDEGRISVTGNEKSLTAQRLPFDLKKIYVDVFQFSKASISYKDKINECRFNASVFLNKIEIKSLQKDDFNFGSVRCSLSNIHYSGNSYHNIEIKTIELDSKKEITQIDDLKIIPEFGKYEFERKLGHQADRVEATIPKIEITNLDVEKLFHKKLFAEKIKISGSRAYIFRDRRLPRLQKISPLPVAFMKKLPIDIRVKTCELASSTVEYDEYPKAGFGQIGILRLERISVTLSPLINHPIASDPASLIMKVNASIMGSGTAYATITMPVQKNKPYYVRGMIKRLELTKLNSSSENLGKIRIKSGLLDFLFFDFSMTEERSTGKIIGAYHRLIIQQLKKHTDKKNVADFASFMLRRLIIPLNKDKSLPERKRTGKVNYTRDPTRFVSYYFLQSLLTGIKATFTLGFLLPK